MVMEPDGPTVAAGVAMKLASEVKEAVRPVAFLQDDGTDDALPVTKWIAAHYTHEQWSMEFRTAKWVR